MIIIDDLPDGADIMYITDVIHRALGDGVKITQHPEEP